MEILREGTFLTAASGMTTAGLKYTFHFYSVSLALLNIKINSTLMIRADKIFTQISTFMVSVVNYGQLLN